ncbi:MAG: class I SAM-dependent rRNA methyltransferase [Roseateles asaccharophilus]|uniref:23S rRNA (Cytosine1962-C5)-methyltransferase n=1 Tax=Roseateles asaccharophilus TaxID=582607 RepID=A0A4R6N4S8_9BURK|nr:class I SAM-dependent methyltransferase [Roseateles asaccharophilus]MDN3544238.1 class I SAM-dependent methyltransferase [Roseateles asaccharophilus]TDP09170.1 23S rRNA (cytosine1962-C5)-methyltransferase [Roseateles asaccharophilus]
MKVIRLRAGRERSLQRRHPWVFESAIAKGGADPGETVRVESAEGEFLAWAAFSPASQIRVRAWSFDAAERIDAAFFERRIARALAMRERLHVPSDAVRLVHGESDGLPGLIVDRYGDTLVAQFGTAGVERWKTVIVEALLRQTGLKRFYERSDASVRALEGLPEQTGWLAGEGATELTIREHDWRLSLDIATGHKTGYYLDQRDNRRRFAEVVRQHGCKRVLNCFSYTGGFSVAALAGGAERVISVDSSGPALARASAHVALNGFEAARHEALDADVNKTLRALIAAGEQFDAIVLDPPKLAPTSAHAERAARAYKDINRLGLKLLAPGGLLFTFSCSGGVEPELFHKIVAGAGMDAQVDAYILERVAAAPDHPQTLYFPEGDYLKGLLLLKQG